MYNLITWKTMITVRNKYTEAKTGDKYLPSGPGTSKIGFFFSAYCHTHRPWPAEELKERKMQIKSKEKCLWYEFVLRVELAGKVVFVFNYSAWLLKKAPNPWFFLPLYLGFEKGVWPQGHHASVISHNFIQIKWASQSKLVV